MPDGGINALSGLQHTVGLISAAPSGTLTNRFSLLLRIEPHGCH
ncbi:hypothetical protein HMPREF3212_00054 [Citrobacter freundii]|nr:hypothetical protein HMPREF3212_00054 [Citrobacter freundii]